MSTPFTDDDRAFIRGILNCPADLTGWLAYADWLDEHDAPDRAEFLRLQVQHGQPTEPHEERDEAQARLVELRRRIDRDWLAVFDRPRIENCDELFAFKCPRQWENLDATNRNGVRHCSKCDKPVYYCHDITDAREHARRGHCVAVSLGVRRRPDDLHEEWERYVTMGVMIEVPPDEVDAADEDDDPYARRRRRRPEPRVEHRPPPRTGRLPELPPELFRDPAPVSDARPWWKFW